MISDGRFVNGQIYSLNEISDELQMSRTPIRDAVLRLSNEGCIDLLPSRGFRLHAISTNELRARFHFSNAIEGYAVYCMAKEVHDTKGIPASVQQLCSLAQQMAALDFDSVSFGEFTRLDNAFHHVIVNSVESAHFSDFFKNHQAGFINSPELHLTTSPLPYIEIYRDHQRILDAIWAGDPPSAYAAMLAHSDAIYDNYAATYSPNSRYFGNSDQTDD